MSRDDGFAHADEDTDKFADPKFRKLWRLVGDEATMARCVSLHDATLCASWGRGERVAAEDAAPDWLSDLPALVVLLAKAGLLADDGRVPQRAWERWFGPANETRERKRARDREHQRGVRRRRPAGDPPASHERLDSPSLGPSFRPSVPPSGGPSGVPSRPPHAGAGAGATDGRPARRTNTTPARVAQEETKTWGEPAEARRLREEQDGTGRLRGRPEVVADAQGRVVPVGLVPSPRSLREAVSVGPDGRWGFVPPKTGADAEQVPAGVPEGAWDPETAKDDDAEAVPLPALPDDAGSGLF